MSAADFVHDLAPLLAATRERPHKIIMANPQPPIGSIVELAAASVPEVVRCFEVVGHGDIRSIACVLLAPMSESG